MLVSTGDLGNAAKKAQVPRGVAAAHARLQTDLLVEAELRGLAPGGRARRRDRARRAQALCDGIALPGALYDELHALAEG
ncbi:hypothetical protein [Pseudooceanicola nanhaiensis]|uniref:hypothetical protein n=1 Tax=Pseudooceanicola nanhaiensis TaxID=375761 RepID=UPI00351122AA